MTADIRHAYLKAMGIQAWQARAPAEGVIVASPAVTDVVAVDARPPDERITPVEISPRPLQPVSMDTAETWAALQAEVSGCTACKLHQGRTKTVFGVGHQRAQWMIIGEAPGAEEDIQGEPFVGRAGKLLNEMLFAVGLKREQIYIANIVKCRPPNNREPHPDEAAACSRYLRAQIDLIQPKLIVCVGRIAATNLLGTHPTLSQYRGKLHRYADTAIPVVVTYHPAYLLRNPLDKRRAWQDLQFAVSVYHPGLQ